VPARAAAVFSAAADEELERRLVGVSDVGGDLWIPSCSEHLGHGKLTALVLVHHIKELLANVWVKPKDRVSRVLDLGDHFLP